MKIMAIAWGIIIAAALLILVISTSTASANHRDDPEGCDFLPECIENEHWCDVDLLPDERFETYKGVEYDKLAGCPGEEEQPANTTLTGQNATDDDSKRDPRKKCRVRWFGAKLHGEPTYWCFDHEYERTYNFRWRQFEVMI